MRKTLLVILLLSICTSVYAAGGIEMIETRRVCESYPNSEQCAKLSEQARSYCSGNLSDPRCVRLHYLQKSRCDVQPDLQFCQEYRDKVGQYCGDNPDAETCLNDKVYNVCIENPLSEKCSQAKAEANKKYCEKNQNTVPCF